MSLSSSHLQLQTLESKLGIPRCAVCTQLLSTALPLTAAKPGRRNNYYLCTEIVVAAEAPHNHELKRIGTPAVRSASRVLIALGEARRPGATRRRQGCGESLSNRRTRSTFALLSTYGESIAIRRPVRPCQRDRHPTLVPGRGP